MSEKLKQNEKRCECCCAVYDFYRYGHACPICDKAYRAMHSGIPSRAYMKENECEFD